MTIKVRLASFTSNAGDRVEFSSSGVTCLVGGNNAGKSRTLSDIAGKALSGFEFVFDVGRLLGPLREVVISASEGMMLINDRGVAFTENARCGVQDQRPTVLVVPRSFLTSRARVCRASSAGRSVRR